VDYLEFVDPDRISPSVEVHGETLLATALKLGKARLIDNLLIRS
jgi:pantoate--beta-alanine ligase